jgi:hypothetical protein
MAVLPVVAVAGIVIGAVALVYLFFGKLGGGADTAAQVTTQTPAATSAAPSATATSPAGQPPSAVTTAATGLIDKTISVSVYNDSGTAGLGRKAADKLTAAGWTLGQLGNWTGAPVTETTVYFGSDAQRASAQSIAKTVGKGTLKLSSAKAGEGIAVVVGADLRGAAAVNATTRSRTPAKAAGGGTTGTRAPAPTASTATPKATGAATKPAVSPSPTGSPAN